MEDKEENNCDTNITKHNVTLILSNDIDANGEMFEKYYIRHASDKMLGFLCDYWRLKVHLTPSKKVLHYFIKAIPATNEAKAQYVKELDLLDKELFFYDIIKKSIAVPGIRPWSPGYVTKLDNAIVFKDLGALHYKVRDKFKRFDMLHTLEGLKALARFHASSIITEEIKSKELGRQYSLNEDFETHLGKAGYTEEDVWYLQCMDGLLQAVKMFSNYSAKDLEVIEKYLPEVWSSALTLSDPSKEHKNVICHRDLWNNNIMFHYSDNGEPDDCVVVDFQAARYQPPAGDVMLLLCCNLDPKYRENNLNRFLYFYLDELWSILKNHDVNPDIICKEKFFESAYSTRKLGLVLCACLMPQFWIDEDETTRIFCDTAQFQDILFKNKSSFIIKMMQSNPDYKTKVMEVFEELIDRYCL